MTTDVEDVLPEDMPTMKEVYDQHTGHQPQVNETPSYTQALDEYTRTSENEIKGLFPLVHNPMISIYIDPHISQAGIPIPGYSTSIKLYRADAYALPGEQ